MFCLVFRLWFLVGGLDIGGCWCLVFLVVISAVCLLLIVLRWSFLAIYCCLSLLFGFVGVPVRCRLLRLLVWFCWFARVWLVFVDLLCFVAVFGCCIVVVGLWRGGLWLDCGG